MLAYAEDALGFGPFTLHRSRKLLLDDDRPVRLVGRTLDLLIALVERSGEVVSKLDLIAYVWRGESVEDATLRAHISALRTVLGEGQNGRRFIVNVPGRGYCFVAEVGRSRPREIPEANAAPVASAGHELPAQLTRVVGREEVIATVAKQVSMRRFSCIVGPAGMGKTTVALAAAEKLSSGYPDGVRFADLSLVSDPLLVPSAVGAALGAVVSIDDAVRSLVKLVTDKSMLVVLDNCDRVAVAAVELAVALLKGAPHVHVLATCREPLRAEGEWLYRLSPLALPPADVKLTAAEAHSYAAVRLFVERAIASVDSFSLSDTDAPIVCEICQRLDGMPLAIELAAARVQAFGIRGLLRALDDRLSTLASLKRTTSPRHRTLAALLDWSHQMLSESEKTTLRRLSVFNGGFTLDSAQAVVADEGLESQRVMECIISLSSKSFITTDVRSAEVRYRLLETTRAYASSKLHEAAEVSKLRVAHARRICDLLDAEKARDASSSTADWLADRAWLIDDVRAAIDWAFGEAGDAELGGRLTAAAIPLGHHLSLLEEFCQRVNTALRSAPRMACPDALLEMRLNIAFSALICQTAGPGSPPQLAAVARALELSEVPSVGRFRTEALNTAWSSSYLVGEYAEAARYAQALGTFAREQRDAGSALVADRLLAQTRFFEGKHADAQVLAERVLSHPTRTNRISAMQPVPLDRRVSMGCVLARSHWIQGKVEHAIELAEECVEVARSDVGYALCQALVFGACPIAMWTDDRVTARALAIELVAHSDKQNVGYWRRWGECYLRVLDRRDALDAGTESLDPVAFDLSPYDYKLRDMIGTLDVFDGDPRSIERAELGLCGWCASEVHRAHGEWLLKDGESAMMRARSLFERAIQLARDQGALSWELKASMSLARLLCRQGNQANAKPLVASIYGRFSEGFETSDLVAARKLLAQLDSK